MILITILKVLVRVDTPGNYALNAKTIIFESVLTNALGALNSGKIFF